MDRDIRKQNLRAKIYLEYDMKNYIDCLGDINKLFNMLNPEELEELKFCCLERSFCYRYLKELDKAEYWANEAMKYLPNPDIKNDILWQLCLIFKDKKEYNEADQMFIMLEDFYLSEHRYKEVAGIYLNRANMQLEQKHYDQAEDFYLVSEKFYNIDDRTKEKELNNLYESLATLYIKEIQIREELNNISKTKALEYINKLNDELKRKELKKQLLKGGE